MNNTRTMKIRELLNMSDVSIDVYDNVCEEISVAFEWDGTLELSEDGKNYFAEVLDYDITIGDSNGYAYGVVDVDGDEGVWQKKLKAASEFFYAAAGYCSCEDFDRWFPVKKDDDPDDRSVVEIAVERLLQTDDGGLDIIKRELNAAIEERGADVTFEVWSALLNDVMWVLEQKHELTNVLMRMPKEV